MKFLVKLTFLFTLLLALFAVQETEAKSSIKKTDQSGSLSRSHRIQEAAQSFAHSSAYSYSCCQYRQHPGTVAQTCTLQFGAQPCGTPCGTLSGHQEFAGGHYGNEYYNHQPVGLALLMDMAVTVTELVDSVLEFTEEVAMPLKTDGGERRSRTTKHFCT
ncbi:hypothetical protein CEXT_660201 [Caerostris extrusa]|uniref:Uncharacterized protein n=1 Tax=Caerostris extrusa TaxID=172846 RepID=A0AAV4VBM9_CAEEX|nr:hypothetical protein CEXT_660201 [Caerostris extrusa]